MTTRTYKREPRLDGQDRENALKKIPTWTFNQEKDAIQKNFKFKDFKKAFAFMTKVADKAEEVIFLIRSNFCR
jgi:4a-hydroxytetrahydrobiopterin dehydratase